jgi:hypothetical protein
MSATEVIEMIKKLPPEEQAEVREFVRRTETPPASDAAKTMDKQGIEIGRAYIERHPELFRKLAQ